MNKLPKIVDLIKEEISIKLGRQSTVRKVKNREEYYFLDLAFSYFQKADRNRRNDYRTGFAYWKDECNANYLDFNIVYSPVMESFFKTNFNYQKFIEVFQETQKYRK